MSFLALRDVAFQYPGTPPVVQGIDLALAAGEIHCLVGRSGCGKTTVLKLAAGLLAPSAGRIEVRGGATLGPGEVGFVFQAPTLLEWLRVRDNVLLPVSLQRQPTPADAHATQALLARLGLAGLAERYPRQLSGGQQSRVALARALVTAPALLLLDEPFAALDALTREELQCDLRELAKARGTTVLFVTHDVGESVFLGDRVSVLAGGRLVRTIVSPPGAQRDTGAFGAACAQVRGALGQAVAASEAAPA
ncbi:MAG: putative type nitrate/sulfonate/bicarbonate transport system, permease component [Ramlibacter sp.]|jgi:NitT/TauT family transport system ATP-binding protein|uniref:ABC transporter ATP-binding protein n=1 Tax=Ramlibacter sp. TaxID=1917967 RepID=UPI002614E7FE|nr:ABC transporter ATP-binding protein [Ramlibacter sp.]MDB5749913.1 putative type nitrate/sulfonate/bicarbonate transport system, permease component [Ramlibacter sp.]